MREQAGRFSRIEFARACHTSESHVKNIENGHKRPSPQLLAAIETELGTNGLLAELAAAAGSAVRRRSVLRSLALMGVFLPGTEASGPDVDGDQSAAVAAVTASLRVLDNQHGGGHAHHPIVAYFTNVAHPAVRHAATETARTAAAAAAAELALLAGWSAFDAGHHASARTYFDEATSLAAAAAMPLLACEAVIAASNQAAIGGDATGAARHAEAAIAAATGTGDRALAGEARMALAHAHALAGDTRAAAAAMNAAARDMDRADAPGAPAWIGHVGPAWFDGRIAQCLHLAGDRANAAAAAARTAERTKAPSRGTALNLAHTALVMFAADRPDEGARYAGDAWTAGRSVQSARLDDYWWRIGRAADRFAGIDAVAALRETMHH
nr:helix-turn-helix transcriptional regulator [Glycomyces amatae]